MHHLHLRRHVLRLLPLWVAGVAMGMSGCVERELIATSEPSGALVSLNNEEISRTPLGREFQWYGYYDATVQAEGHETLKTVTPVVAPPWLWFPLDLVMEVLPVTIRDVHRVHYKLTPTLAETVEPKSMINRARSLQTQLQSSDVK